MTLSLRIAPLLALAIIAGWLAPAPVPAEETAPTGEYQVKVAMIFNILSYVEWPGELFFAESSPLTVCVLGTGPLETVVTTLNGQKQKGRPLAARKISHAEEAKKCHVLVVSSSEKSQLATILDKSGQTPLLTISDLSGFSEVGGIIELCKVGSRIRFEINLASARQHRIKISSQLLKLARTVRDDK
jgi:YfiR/HmsC-like